MKGVKIGEPEAVAAGASADEMHTRTRLQQIKPYSNLSPARRILLSFVAVFLTAVVQEAIMVCRAPR